MQIVKHYKSESGDARLVYRVGDVFVKVWIASKRAEFGTRYFVVTASHCDENGDAIKEGGAFRVHDQSEEIEHKSDGPDDLAQRVHDATVKMVNRVVRAIANEGDDPLAAIRANHSKP